MLYACVRGKSYFVTISLDTIRLVLCPLERMDLTWLNENETCQRCLPSAYQKPDLYNKCDFYKLQYKAIIPQILSNESESLF